MITGQPKLGVPGWEENQPPLLVTTHLAKVKRDLATFVVFKIQRRKQVTC
jgi:hypothetical protein